MRAGVILAALSGTIKEVAVLSPGEGKLPVNGLKMASSDLIINSGGSCTAESTRTFVICCNPGVTSVGFQSSSSTSFAERDIRD